MSAVDDIEMHDEAKRIKVYDFLGRSIFVGCNARANQRLVEEHKADHSHCLWMHVVGRKGPSVILCLGDGKEPPEMIVLRYAASRALRMSGLKNGQVLYAPLADVYKPEQSQDGIFRTWRTSVVQL